MAAVQRCRRYEITSGHSKRQRRGCVSELAVAIPGRPQGLRARAAEETAHRAAASWPGAAHPGHRGTAPCCGTAPEPLGPRVLACARRRTRARVAGAAHCALARTHAGGLCLALSGMRASATAPLEPRGGAVPPNYVVAGADAPGLGHASGPMPAPAAVPARPTWVAPAPPRGTTPTPLGGRAGAARRQGREPLVSARAAKAAGARPPCRGWGRPRPGYPRATEGLGHSRPEAPWRRRRLLQVEDRGSIKELCDCSITVLSVLMCLNSNI
eukprot:XP_008666091.1 skin secretory protein xP2-like [Zea mays]